MHNPFWLKCTWQKIGELLEIFLDSIVAFSVKPGKNQKALSKWLFKVVLQYIFPFIILWLLGNIARFEISYSGNSCSLQREKFVFSRNLFFLFNWDISYNSLLKTLVEILMKMCDTVNLAFFPWIVKSLRLSLEVWLLIFLVIFSKLMQDLNDTFALYSSHM